MTDQPANPPVRHKTGQDEISNPFSLVGPTHSAPFLVGLLTGQDRTGAGWPFLPSLINLHQLCFFIFNDSM